MRHLLYKSIELNRFQIVLTFIVILILIRIMSHFMTITMYRTEQFFVSANISVIQQFLMIQEILAKKKDPTCQFLKNPALFDHQINKPNSRWSYNPEKATLTYQVVATDYFQSNIGPQIEIHFACNDGRVTLQTSPYLWCKTPGYWGCAAW